jgi:hypothetical protein
MANHRLHIRYVPLPSHNLLPTHTFLDNKYKILHVIASTREVAQLWQSTLLSLRSLRQSVMSGLVSPSRMWERHYWRGADMSCDERLELAEMEQLCRRLNVSLSRDELLKRFKVRSPLRYLEVGVDLWVERGQGRQGVFGFYGFPAVCEEVAGPA